MQFSDFLFNGEFLFLKVNIMMNVLILTWSMLLLFSGVRGMIQWNHYPAEALEQDPGTYYDI